ncbi:MAG: DUF4350 domain-containing protein [Terriglobales bacterium]
MPVTLEAGDRKVLIVTGILLVTMLAATLLASPQEEEAPGYPSTYSAASGGGKAAFLLLKESGYKVERWESSALELPSEPKGTLLILVDPQIPPSAAEQQAVRDFLSKGGRVLISGFLGSAFVPEYDLQLPQRFGEVDLDPKAFTATLPSPLTRGVPEIRQPLLAHWGGKYRAHLPLYRRDQDVVMVTYRVGEGQVIWWANSLLLSNAGLMGKGNLELLLNLAGARGEQQILWDEYYHGRRRSLWSYFGVTSLVWSVAQLGLLIVAIAITFSRRSGPVRAPAAESRLSPLEFVETLGGLYARARASPAAVEIAHQRFRYLLGRRLGLPPDTAAQQLARSAHERLGAKERELHQTLERARTAAGDFDLTDQQALALVQQFHQHAAEMELAGKRK